MDIAMRFGLSFLSVSTLAAIALAAPAFGQNTAFVSEAVGTYRTEQVFSAAECSALCQADLPKCRGSFTVQMDTTKPEMICRLNDGKSPKSAFYVAPPEPLKLDTALADLNAYRNQNGLSSLILDESLNKASELHAEDMARYQDARHEGSDGSSSGDRIQRQGYYFTISGENVASGQRSWDAVFEAWKKSPGHNANLLQPDVTEFGIAVVHDPNSLYQTYWAMLVAAPLDAETTEYLRYQRHSPPMAASGAEGKAGVNP